MVHLRSLRGDNEWDAVRILTISNESKVGNAPGQRDALERLVGKSWIESVDFVMYKSKGDQGDDFSDVLDAVSSSNYDILFIWSPRNFPSKRDDFERLVKAIGIRPVIYWEGDPWTSKGIKKYFEQMFWWAEISNAIFTVAGNPQLETFKRYNSNVFLIPHTYCHIQFANEELEAPGRVSEFDKIVMIGNQVATVPFLYGVPGSGIRFSLASVLKFKYREGFALYGSNWPKWLKASQLDYGDQASTVRRSLFSVNWDNFPHHESYASDRLPVALLAGRIHITTAHRGTKLYGNLENGLIECADLQSMLATTDEVFNSNPEYLTRVGLQGHMWVKNRLSHREAGQFMISKVYDQVPVPKLFPWNQL